MFRELILLLAVGVFCFGAVDAQAPRTWQPFKSAEGRFSVSMPCKPEVETQNNADDGTTSVYHNCYGPDGSYIVTYSDFREALDSKTMLSAFAEGVKGNSTLVSEKPVLLGRLPGREMVLASCDEGTAIIYKWHLFVSGKRVYALTVGSGDPVGNTADANKFFASFAITR